MKLRIPRALRPSLLLAVGALAAPAAHAATTRRHLAGRRSAARRAATTRWSRSATSPPRAVDISGWKLWGSNSAGTASSRATVPAGTTLPAGKTFVLRQLRRARSPRPATCSTAPASRTPAASSSATARPVDGRVRLARAPPAAYREGAGWLQPSSGAGGFARKNNGTQDTDDNVADFTGPQTPTPTKCGTACTGTVGPAPCAAGADGIVPITSIQTLGDNAACNGKTVKIRGIVTGIDDLYGSTYDAIYKADSGIWLQEPTRDPSADDVERAVRRRHPPRRRPTRRA